MEKAEEAVGQQWRNAAVCRDVSDAHELFFPPVGVQGGTAVADWRIDKRPTALAICATCAVARECFDYATAKGEDVGVWGGVDFGAGARLGTEARRERSYHEMIAGRVAYWHGRGLAPAVIARRIGVNVRTVYRHLDEARRGS